jgi:hypothetical protein
MFVTIAKPFNINPPPPPRKYDENVPFRPRAWTKMFIGFAAARIERRGGSAKSGCFAPTNAAFPYENRAGGCLASRSRGMGTLTSLIERAPT